MPSDKPFSLRLSGIERESIVDGPGFRYVLFVQGCPHHCEGCHNPQTHDFDGGYVTEDLEGLLQDIDGNPLLQGVTFSGGEPFCQPDALCILAEKVRERGKNIVVYSGFTFEQLLKLGEKKESILHLLKCCDILVDGPFVLPLKDLTLRFKGSSNQRLINLNAWKKGSPHWILPDEW